MKLHFIARSAERKNDAKRLRREGKITAVIYSEGKVGENIAIDGAAFQGVLRQIVKGRLSTTSFTLVGVDGRERKAIIKDIQYNVVNYDVVNLDFEELHEERPVSVKVPIECLGRGDCVGVKQGGVVRQVIRHVQVRCLPQFIPSCFEINVADLNLRQTRRLADIPWSESVRPLANLQEVAVVIVKR